MEARYAPGDDLLVVRHGRCLLLRPGPAGLPEEVVGRLWEQLARPGGPAQVAATVRPHAAGWVLLDTRTGERLGEGAGTLERRDEGWELRIGPRDRTAAPRYPLTEGVVAADAVVAAAVPADAAGQNPTTGLIDGIPPEILAPQRPPDPSHPTERPRVVEPVAREEEHDGLTARRRPDPAPAAHRPDTDHDAHTVMRDAAAAPGPSASAEHLQQSTSDTVLAARCRRGHLTDSLADTCRSCGGPVPPQQPQRVLRPPLGVLVLPDGDRVTLDRPVVLGRSPQPSGERDWPHLVRLPHDTTYLSRMHLRLDLDGWHVLAVDLGSRGGTVVTVPGRDPQRIRPGEPYLLEHGATIALADAYRTTYLTTDEESA